MHEDVTGATQIVTRIALNEDCERAFSGRQQMSHYGCQMCMILLRTIAGRCGLAELSMGMSGDYEAAVELGATMVRVGTAIFGEREAD